MVLSWVLLGERHLPGSRPRTKDLLVYLGDPASKSNLRILFRIGLVYRLTRNLDKARGFVNGALAVCVESRKWIRAIHRTSRE